MAFNGSVSDIDKQKSLQSIADLRSVYKDIRYDWPQLVQGEQSPIEFAISFLDDTSVGLAHRKSEFDELCAATGESLRLAVVENHEIFNNSIGLYHQLLSIAQDSEVESNEIRELIEVSTKDMKDRSTFLKDMDLSSAKYAEMIDVLDAMEYLHEIPSQVDKLVAEKKIHEVYNVIADGHKLALKYNLWSLSAMGATQNYLETQSNNLYDMIVEELKNEIYLKNSVSVKESLADILNSNSPQMLSLKTLKNQLTTLELYIYNSANLDIDEISQALTEKGQKFLEKQLPKLHKHFFKLSTQRVDYSILLDSALNSASESYHYIYMLLSTASKLNKLDAIVEILYITLQLEFNTMIAFTTEESKLKNLHRISRLMKVKALDENNPQDGLSGHSLNDQCVPILQDFGGAFFLKTLAVLQRHKITCSIIDLIKASNEISGVRKRDLVVEVSHATYNFDTVWSTLKQEIDILIMNYIDEASESVLIPKPETNSNRIHQILTKKQIFQFDDMNYSSSDKSSKEIKAVFEDMFPGFNLNTENALDRQSGANDSPYITNEGLDSMIDVLVPKNIFNMRIFMEYFLIMVSGVNKLFTKLQMDNDTTAPASRFFIDVMRNSFLVRLKDQVDHAFQDCISCNDGIKLSNEANNKVARFNQKTVEMPELDDITPLNYFKVPSGSQIYGNSVKFRAMFANLCHIMNTSFSYRHDISTLVIETLQKFADSYHYYYQELLTNGAFEDITEMSIVLPGQSSKRKLKIHQWMRVPALVEVSGDLILKLARHEDASDIINKEIQLMFFQRDATQSIFDVTKEDLLDDEWFFHVCTLLLTASWVLTWLPSMRKKTSSTDTSASDQNLDVSSLKHEYSLLNNGRGLIVGAERSQNIYLTLNLEKIKQFDSIINTFESIRDNALIALRYDLRLKTLYHIGLSFKDDFVLSTEPADSDAFISLYNREIYFIGTKVSDTLSIAQRDSILYGITHFISRAFIRGSELVSVINGNGIKKIMLNIFTSQQMLRSVLRKEDKVDLSLSSRYYELFTSKEQALFAKISQEAEKYSKSEILNLVRLIYSERLKSVTVSSFNKTKYGELVKKVEGLYE